MTDDALRIPIRLANGNILMGGCDEPAREITPDDPEYEWWADSAVPEEEVAKAWVLLEEWRPAEPKPESCPRCGASQTLLIPIYVGPPPPPVVNEMAERGELMFGGGCRAFVSPVSDYPVWWCTAGQHGATTEPTQWELDRQEQP